MAAPALPRGVTGPTRSDFSTGAPVGQWVTVYNGVARVWQTSGWAFARELNRKVGRPETPSITTDTLAALRARMAGEGLDVSQVSASTIDRETLRAALWWTYHHGGTGAGTPQTLVWLTSTMPTVPRLGATIPTPTTPAGRDVASEILTPAATPTPTPTPTPQAGGPTEAQRAAARELDAYVRSHATVRASVRDAEVERLQRAMGGGIAVDGKYGDETRARMRALGVSSPATAQTGTSTGTPTTTNPTTTTPRPGALNTASMGAPGLAALLVVGGLVGAAVYLGNQKAPRERPTPALPTKGGPRVPPFPRTPTGPAPYAGRRPFTAADAARRELAKLGR